MTVSKSMVKRVIAQIEGEDSLAEKYLEYIKTAPEGATVDDFFDYCGVPKSARSDFVYAAIMKQVREITAPKELVKEKRVKFEIEFTVDENNPDTDDFLLYFEEHINGKLLNEELILEDEIPVKRVI